MLPLSDLRRHNQSCMADVEQAASRVLHSGWYVLGSEVTTFERQFAHHCGVSHCIGVANGSEALELALRAVGAGPGAEVLTVANAGGYSTCAILNAGATPSYVDVEVDAHTMDPGAARTAVGPRTAAIIVTHLYGRLADVGALSAVARDAGVPMIEDCAQAHGAVRHGKRAGSFGAVGCFSFYPTKNLGALGDGGAVVTDDTDLADRLRQLRQYGWKSKYTVTLGGGRNSRLDEMQAAILRAKLPHLDEWNARRRAIANAYVKHIAHPDITLPAPLDESSVAHLFVIRTPVRDSLRAHLLANGVETAIHYPVPDHLQPAYSGVCRDAHLAVTEKLAGEVVTLPCFAEMTDEEVSTVIDACSSWKR